MPFLSKAQNRWAHTKEGKKALGGEAAVKEWESHTDFATLPEKKRKFKWAPKRKRAGAH